MHLVAESWIRPATDPVPTQGRAKGCRNPQRRPLLPGMETHAMLVLTRRADQKIVFPSVGITVDVLRVKGNVVKIGIQAPPDVQVLRHEIAGDLATVERIADG